MADGFCLREVAAVQQKLDFKRVVTGYRQRLFGWYFGRRLIVFCLTDTRKDADPINNPTGHYKNPCNFAGLPSKLTLLIAIGGNFHNFGHLKQQS